MDEALSILRTSLETINPGLPVMIVLGGVLVFLLYKYTWFTVEAAISFSAFWAAYQLHYAQVEEDSMVPIVLVGFVVVGFVSVCMLFYTLLFKENG